MVKFHFKNSTVKLRWILHISVLYIPINMGVPFFFSYKQHIQCILRNYAQWPAMSIMLYMSFLIWFLQQPYNAHVVICVLNKKTMVQKVKWYALAHTINPELTLNQWVIQSLWVKRYEHLKFERCCQTALETFITIYTSSSSACDVCGSQLSQQKLLSYLTLLPIC